MQEAEWLKQLEEGDDVLVAWYKSTYGEALEPGHIVRITATMIVLGGSRERRFRRANGREIGGSRRAIILQPTPERQQRYLLSQANKALRAELESLGRREEGAAARRAIALAQAAALRSVEADHLAEQDAEADGALLKRLRERARRLE